jgi:hypothetical protein
MAFALLAASHIIECILKVPTFRLINQHVELIRRFWLLGRGLSLQHPLLLAISKAEGTVLVLEYVALLKHPVDLQLHAAELVEILLSCSSLLLHLVEMAHLLGNLSMLLSLLELLLLDLGSGLAALGGGLHEVARLALRD